MIATENLLQKLEEKMMVLLSELEKLRKDNQHLAHEISELRNQRENNAASLNNLISLLDSVDGDESLDRQYASQPISALAKPVLVQG